MQAVCVSSRHQLLVTSNMPLEHQTVALGTEDGSCHLFDANIFAICILSLRCSLVGNSERTLDLKVDGNQIVVLCHARLLQTTLHDGLQSKLCSNLKPCMQCLV